MTAPVFSTMGCRLNAYETEAMKELATAAGVDNAVIVNTCAVTEEAVRKSRQLMRRTHRENPGAKLVMSGCYASLDPEHREVAVAVAGHGDPPGVAHGLGGVQEQVLDHETGLDLGSAPEIAERYGAHGIQKSFRDPSLTSCGLIPVFMVDDGHPSVGVSTDQ